MNTSGTPPPSARRWASLVFATALVSFALIELAAFVTLQLARYRAPERFVPDWDAYTAGIDQKTIDHLNRYYFDATLGWDFHPGFTSQRRNSKGDLWHLTVAADGSRANSRYSPNQPIQIATYGDSFTFGDEVDDDQTWQYYLSNAFSLNIANFGVDGYGPDQMLLKYQRETWSGTPPDIVILAIYEGDLNRALTRFYPLYAPNSQQFLGFKPRYILDQNAQLRLIASPKTRPVQDRADLRRLIDAARDHDAWYERRVEIAFPYSFAVLKLARLLPAPAYGEPWSDAGETALLQAIIDRFVALARGRGQRPVLMFIPRVEAWRQGRTEPSYRDFVTGLRAKHGDLLTIDVAEASFEPSRFNVVPFAGHASVYGNRVIARHLATALMPLIDRSSAAGPRSGGGPAGSPRPAGPFTKG